MWAPKYGAIPKWPVIKNLIIKIQIGDFVEHQRFGKGLVLELDGTGADKKAKIKFKGIGEKNLLLNFAKLKKIPPFSKEELFWLSIQFNKVF